MGSEMCIRDSSRSAHYFSGLVPRDYRHQLLDYLSYRTPTLMGAVPIEQVLVSWAGHKTDAPIDEPVRADKQTFSDNMKLLSDKKAK